MKRISKILVCMTLISALFAFGCTGVSADDAASWTAPSNYKMLNNETGVIGTLKTSMLEPDAKKFMEDYYNNPDSSGYLVSLADENSNHLPTILFIKLKGSITKSSFALMSDNSVSIRNDVEYVSFNLVDGVPNPKLLTRPAGDDARYSLSVLYLIQFYAIVNVGHPKTAISYIWKPVHDSPMGEFRLVYDDIGNTPDPPPESSEPEPPVSSEPPAPPYNPNIPTIPPTDNEYVPYDTTLWNGFLDYIMNAIGKSTNIAFLILAIILGFWIVTRIVSKYTKT